MKKFLKTIVLIFIVTFGYQVISNFIDRINETTEARQNLFTAVATYQIGVNEYEKKDDKLVKDVSKIDWSSEWEQYNQKIYNSFRMIKNVLETAINDISNEIKEK